MVNIGNEWDTVLSEFFAGETYRNIRSFLKKEYFQRTVFPPMGEIFNAFRLTPYDSVKVVILGQDPYHEYGQAHGLSFSVRKNVKLPPSLKNIFKELQDDLGIENHTGDLTYWATQGVLLLNATLTVREGQANSHKNCGWLDFTDYVIKKLNDKQDPVIFILWGGFARSKKALIDTERHFIIESAHPSPLSCFNGFFGSKPFSKTNELLLKLNKTPIDWKL
ncbi:MAG: uracil-DNA glycosylase [Christensenellaceae bacterium]